LESLDAFAATGRQVVYYDQLGTGNSEQPHDPSLWTVDYYLHELAEVRKELELEEVHLVGQSWGGMLAMEYALTQPAGLRSLILASALSNTAEWVAEANRLRAELPADVQAILKKHEGAGTTDGKEYEDAMMVFYRKHLCRMDPWPAGQLRTFEKLERNPEVYHTMWGTSEFYVTGTLKDWDIRDRLHEISVPTLITSGRYDESTPAMNQRLREAIPGAKWQLFEKSAHQSHAEETELYCSVLDQFLNDVELRARLPRAREIS
jgi:proline-specific peptidase